MQPAFQAAGILIEDPGLCESAMIEPQLRGPSLDQSGMFVFCQVYYLLSPENIDNIGKLIILLLFLV